MLNELSLGNRLQIAIRQMQPINGHMSKFELKLINILLTS